MNTSYYPALTLEEARWRETQHSNLPEAPVPPTAASWSGQGSLTSVIPGNQRTKSSVIQDKLFITDLQGHNNSYICFARRIISFHLYLVYNMGEECFNTAPGQTSL